MQNYQAIIATPVGKLGIGTVDNKLASIDYLQDDIEPKDPTCPLVKKIVADLEKYFKIPSHFFSCPLVLSGTDFQQQVLKALQNIPAGETRSYSEIASQLNTSPRAVGNACRRNPIPIIIPCHRITAKHHIGGYGGDVEGKKIAIKHWLLAHENSTFYGDS